MVTLTETGVKHSLIVPWCPSATTTFPLLEVIVDGGRWSCSSLIFYGVKHVLASLAADWVHLRPFSTSCLPAAANICVCMCMCVCVFPPPCWHSADLWSLSRRVRLPRFHCLRGGGGYFEHECVCVCVCMVFSCTSIVVRTNYHLIKIETWGKISILA